MHGDGTLYYPDERTYKGEFKNDKRDGFGEFFYPDGRIFKGWWKEGVQHGEGTFVLPSGKERNGIWENGKRSRWIDGTMTNSSFHMASVISRH